MRKIYAIFFVAAMLFSAASFSQSFDMYLKIDGIPGTSTNERHKNEIQLYSYSTGLSSCPETNGGGGGSKVCKPFISDLNTMLKMDKSLIPLKMALLQGKI